MHAKTLKHRLDNLSNVIPGVDECEVDLFTDHQTLLIGLTISIPFTAATDP